MKIKIHIRHVNYNESTRDSNLSEKISSKESDELVRWAKQYAASRRENIKNEIHRDIQNEWRIVERKSFGR